MFNGTRETAINCKKSTTDYMLLCRYYRYISIIYMLLCRYYRYLELHLVADERHAAVVRPAEGGDGGAPVVDQLDAPPGPIRGEHLVT